MLADFIKSMNKEKVKKPSMGMGEKLDKGKALFPKDEESGEEGGGEKMSPEEAGFRGQDSTCEECANFMSEMEGCKKVDADFSGNSPSCSSCNHFSKGGEKEEEAEATEEPGESPVEKKPASKNAILVGFMKGK